MLKWKYSDLKPSFQVFWACVWLKNVDIHQHVQYIMHEHTISDTHLGFVVLVLQIHLSVPIDTIPTLGWSLHEERINYEIIHKCSRHFVVFVVILYICYCQLMPWKDQNQQYDSQVKSVYRVYSLIFLKVLLWQSHKDLVNFHDNHVWLTEAMCVQPTHQLQLKRHTCGDCSYGDCCHASHWVLSMYVPCAAFTL